MSTTVDIIIKGISIIYRKGDFWKILFPIDAERCHKLLFSYRKDGGADVIWGSLADMNNIDLTVTGHKSTSGESLHFRDFAYNLTADPNYSHGKTHGKVRLRRNPLPIHFVVMTIPNAYFTVNTYLEDDAEGHTIPKLVNTYTNDKSEVKSLIHTFKATIQMNDDGVLTVPAGDPPFKTENDHFYELTFDNDCERPVVGQNDMDMFYDVIEEFDPATGNRLYNQFRIGGVGQLRIEKTPPDFAEGLTCLGGKITDPGSIADLP